jgi:hypothetical protein
MIQLACVARFREWCAPLEIATSIVMFTQRHLMPQRIKGTRLHTE